MGNNLPKAQDEEEPYCEPFSAVWSNVKTTQGRKTGSKSKKINGTFLSERYVPEPVLEILMSYFELEDILTCAKVCRQWKDITTMRSFWKLVCHRYSVDWDTIPEYIKRHDCAWIFYFKVCQKNIFTKNFISNPSGESSLKDWQIGRNGGFGWQVEEVPIDCSPLPFDPLFPGSQSCFVSSSLNEKWQVIDLWRCGLNPAIMRMSLPFEIECSELFNSRPNNCVFYEWTVQLKDKHYRPFSQQSEQRHLPLKNPGAAEWVKNKASFMFYDGRDEDTVINLRYIFFMHKGMDSAPLLSGGHEGVKIARASVRFRCPPVASDCSDDEPEEFDGTNFETIRRQSDQWEIVVQGAPGFDLDNFISSQEKVKRKGGSQGESSSDPDAISEEDESSFLADESPLGSMIIVEKEPKEESQDPAKVMILGN